MPVGITSRDQRDRLLKEHLWYSGRLRYLVREKRPHGQLSLYDWVHEWKAAHPTDPGPLCLTTRRRLGKTHLKATLAIERALALPGQVIKIGAPWYKQAREIFRPVMRRVLAHCPAGLQPDHTGYTWTFRNPYWRRRGRLWTPSEITLVGVNTDKGDRLRGGDLDLGILDEVRDIKDLKYIQDDILMPMFLDREYPLLVYGTTMPRTLAHDYTAEILPSARREGRAKLFRVANLDRDPMVPPDPEEDLDWTERHEALVLKSITKESPTWQREYLCLEVEDREHKIIPEYVDVEGRILFGTAEAGPEEKADYTEAHRGRPAHFFAYMGGDIGWEDYSAFLWGFHDFDEDLLVIEAEVLKNHTTPKEIAKLIRETEERFYPEHYRMGSIVRYADAEQITLAGLTIDERIPILPPEKYDLTAAIAKLRTRFAEAKIRIHRRCRELRYQLAHGVWNEKRTEFERTIALGHCDAVAGLIYLNRMLPIRRRPGPVRGKPVADEKFYPPWAPKPGEETPTVTKNKTIFREPRRGGENPFR